MDRRLAYLNLSGRIEGMRTTVERDLYMAHRLELFVRVSALSDAVGGDLVGFKEAEHMLEAYIETLKTPTQKVDTGEIKF